MLVGRMLLAQLGVAGKSGAPAVGYCLFYLFFNFKPHGILGFQLSGIACSFCLSILIKFRPRGILWLRLSNIVCSFLFVHFWPQGILLFELSGILCFPCLSISGLREFWGYSHRVLFTFFSPVRFCLSWPKGNPKRGWGGQI